MISNLILSKSRGEGVGESAKVHEPESIRGIHLVDSGISSIAAAKFENEAPWKR